MQLGLIFFTAAIKWEGQFTVKLKLASLWQTAGEEMAAKWTMTYSNSYVLVLYKYKQLYTPMNFYR